LLQKIKLAKLLFSEAFAIVSGGERVFFIFCSIVVENQILAIFEKFSKETKTTRKYTNHGIIGHNNPSLWD
jgi:hypothetical protein